MRGYHRFDVEDGLSASKDKDPSKQANWKILAKKCCIAMLIVMGFACLSGMLLPKKAAAHYHSFASASEGQLKFVVVTHRHGARTGLWKLDFEQDRGLEWSRRMGALTPTGFEQAFVMGQALRKNYWEALSREYGNVLDHVSVFSTYIGRTVDTAHGALLGFFSNAGTQPNLSAGDCSCLPSSGDRSDLSCAAECLGVEVPVDGIPEVTEAEDSLLLQFDICKGWFDEVHKMMNSTDFEQDAQEHFKAEFDLAAKVAGSNEVCMLAESRGDKDTALSPPECGPVNIRMLEIIWNNAECAWANQHKYVDVEDVEHFIDSLSEPIQWYWHQRFLISRGPLAAGILLHKIVQSMEEFLPSSSSNPPKPRDGIVLYSAHDTTVAALLSVLGLEGWKLPYFTSQVALELRTHDERNEDDYYVRVLYDGKAVRIPGCGEVCSWKEFAKLMEPRQRLPSSCTRLHKLS